MSAIFVMRSGRARGGVVPVDRPLVVGRGSDCDVVLEDVLVSHRHAELRPAADGVELRDLGSRNGTWVDGVRLDAAVLLHGGEHLTMGESEFDILLAGGYPTAVRQGRPEPVHGLEPSGGTGSVADAGGEPHLGHGWQLPAHSAVSDAENALPPLGGQDQSGRPDRPEWQPPRPLLPNSLSGQVTDVSVDSLVTSTEPVPVVTLRLERNDPHAGRTFVASVRLTGGDALGFAHTGDWVEAIGKQRPAHLVAYRCINHTTGATYDNRPERKMLQSVIFLIFLIFAALVLAWIAFGAVQVFTSQPANGAGHTSAELWQPPAGQCLKSGPPRPFCGAIS